MLNWLCRYAVATATLLDDDRQLTTSLLDAGSGPHGLACAVSDTPFVGLDMDFPLTPAPAMLAIRNAPGPLPFADASFGAVLSLDVLEHVPPGERSGFVAELARVSTGKVLVACPSSEMRPVDDLLRTMFARAGLPMPGWLSEHDEHGLPAPEEIAEHCAAPEGFRTSEVPVPNGMLSTMASLADFTPETAAGASLDATRNPAAWLELFESAVFGDSWRKAYLIERLEAADPIVDRSCLPETTLAALRCPRCAGGLARPAEAILRCDECAQVAARDRRGWWDVRPGRRTLWCEPPWTPEALSKPLHGFADLDAGDATLVLRAPAQLDTETALAAVMAALAGRELPEHVDVELLSGPVLPEEPGRRADATSIDPGALSVPAGSLT